MDDYQDANLTRASSPELDSVLGKMFPVLDHGFIRVIDYMGNDAAVVQAARVSYGEGTETARSDEGLIRYLMRHKHTTPFEMCEIKLHLKMPLFVARQWLRHRTANVNEYSGRYSIMSDQFYLPPVEDLARQSKTNKQGREGSYDKGESDAILGIMQDNANFSHQVYKGLIDVDGIDLARELARINLPLSTYTEFYWKIDIHNLMHFLHLRADSHAQKEIRVYAEDMLMLLGLWMPMTARAFADYVANAHTFSAQEMEALRSAMQGSAWTHLRELVADRKDLSDREKTSFLKSLSWS